MSWKCSFIFRLLLKIAFKFLIVFFSNVQRKLLFKRCLKLPIRNGVSKCNLHKIMAIKSIVILDLIETCILPNETIKILVESANFKSYKFDSLS